jgi:PIN domain nuclease of toxin-antitoxin system
MSSTPTTIEPLYVVDTNALIWYLTKDKKLGNQAFRVFEAAERGETQLVLSAISITEMYFANVKNSWFPDFTQIYHDLTSSPHFQIEAFRAEVVLRFAADAAVPEMHDRIIAGLARRLGASLIASDPLIIQANIVKTVW